MLQINDPAPSFSCKNQKEKIINFPTKGQKAILFFYPKDNTPGCTAEACSLRDDYSLLLQKGYQVLGVSIDTPKAHVKFIEKYSLPYDLIADTDKEVVRAYQVWGQKKFMGKTYDGIYRTTFVINEDGIITHILDKIDTKNAGAQLLKILE